MSNAQRFSSLLAGRRVALALAIVLSIAAMGLVACDQQVATTVVPATATALPAQLPSTPPAELPAPGATAIAPPPATAVPQPISAGQPEAFPEPPAIGQPNRLLIPKIALDTPIVDVGWSVVERGGQRFTEWDTADNAAGRHINSARPGEQGNVVLSGHHNTKGEVFRRISDLELAPGDQIYLYDQAGRRFTYVVDEVTNPPLLEVGATPEQRLANARYIQPTSDARVTLVTCWPYWTNTHRVVVVGKLVP